MAYYINNNHYPVRIKVWTLKSKQITEDSVRFLTSLGIRVRVHRESTPLYYKGRTYQFTAGDTRIEIETTSPEQDSMLHLKFDNDLLLLLDEFVLPNQLNDTIFD